MVYVPGRWRVGHAPGAGFQVAVGWEQLDDREGVVLDDRYLWRIGVRIRDWLRFGWQQREGIAETGQDQETDRC